VCVCVCVCSRVDKYLAFPICSTTIINFLGWVKQVTSVDLRVEYVE
jgi:hypothetical protein